MTTPTLTIGKLAAAAGVNVETIRYYQRLKLIIEPAKPDQGYRHYPAEYVLRVRFIKRAQQLGFTLKEIQELLELGDGHCQQVQQLAQVKLKKIRERITDLTAMYDALDSLLTQCQTSEADDARCALIETITANSDQCT
ncbi:MAG TPA: MerR family transcriptional regulator [Gammaproteobacteria bacterium]|nr:MerR family transcriptional regulator [Gammaproteobacteria bacterium]